MGIQYTLSEETLRSIYLGDETDPNVVALLCPNGEVLSHPRNRAYGNYWHRRVQNGMPVRPEEIEEVLGYYREGDFSAISRDVIGQFAIYDLLTDDQVRYLLGSVRHGDWAYLQLRARSELSDRSADLMSVVDKLIALRATWAIEEVLERASVDELRSAYEKMMHKSVLTRYDRHLMRESISKMLKRK